MKLDIVAIVMFFIFVGLSVYILIGIQAEGTKCVASPLTYGVIEYSKQLDTQMICTCSFDNPKYTPIIISNGTIKPQHIESMTERQIMEVINLTKYINFSD